MSIGASAEDYLETILTLSKTKPVRSIDIATELHFSKPSVSVAMKKLREDSLITVDADGIITLTKQGKKLAEDVYERHAVISELLISLGVDEKTALEDACKVEHIFSESSFNALKKLATELKNK